MKAKRKATEKPQGEPSPAEKKARGNLITLSPLTPEDALRQAMEAGPMPPDWKPGEK